MLAKAADALFEHRIMRNGLDKPGIGRHDMRVFTQRDGKIKAIVYRMTQLNRKLQGASKFIVYWNDGNRRRL